MTAQPGETTRETHARTEAARQFIRSPVQLVSAMAFPLFRASPEEAAEKLAQGHDSQWIRSVVSLLDQKLQRTPLERLVTLWNLTGSEAGQLFNVSRQAFDKWLEAGPPAERALAIADLTDATDLLERYVKRDRIPVVVRRPSPVTGNKSLIDLAAAGKYDKVLAAVKQMFDLRRVQP